MGVDNTDSDKKKKGFSFGFKGPDFNLPSLSLKGHASEVDQDEEFTKDEDDDKENKEKKSKKGFSFGLKGPDVTLPNMSSKSDRHEGETDGKSDEEDNDDGDGQKK